MDNHPAEAVPSLTKLCTSVLVKYRSYLSNVGWLDPVLLRGVLAYCNSEELVQVEDATRQESERELCWYTWDFWARLYEQKFGRHRMDNAMLKPLPGKPPVDYIAPKTAVGPTADWRYMLERDLAAEQEKADAMRDKLRSMYDKVHQDKKDRSAQVCLIKPPAKRMRTGTGATVTYASEQEKSKAKMLHGLGLVSSAAASGRVVSRVDKPQKPASRGVVAYTPQHVPRRPMAGGSSAPSSGRSTASPATSGGQPAAVHKTAGFTKSLSPYMPVDPKPSSTTPPTSQSGSQHASVGHGQSQRSISSGLRPGSGKPSGPSGGVSNKGGVVGSKRPAAAPVSTRPVKKPDPGPLGLLGMVSVVPPARR